MVATLAWHTKEVCRTDGGAGTAYCDLSTRRRSMRPAAALLLLAAGFAEPIAAQPGAGVISGSVLADQSLRPLAGAQVGVVGTRLGVISDANGRFRLTGVDGDNVSLDIRLIG